MSTKPDKSRLAALEGWLGRGAGWSHRRPWVALGLVLLLSLGALSQAARLQLNPDLTSLLPPSFESVRGLELLKRRFGGVGYAVLVAEDAPPQALIRFAKELAPKLKALPEVEYVDYQRTNDFFEDRALYFLSQDDLQTVIERVEDRAVWEKQRANPLLVDLEDNEKPKLDFDDLINKYKAQYGQALVGKKNAETYYLDREKRMLAILVKPASLASDYSYSKKVIDELHGVVDKIDLKQYSPTLKVEFTGRYQKKLDQKGLMERDLSLSSAVALALVLIYLFLHFRRLAAVLLLVLPLMTGLLWTFGFAGLAIGELNILTGFVGAILLGLGVDHGIHLLSRYQSERAEGADSAAAVHTAFSNTGHAVLLAGITTLIGFAGLTVSEFRAFREFGIVTAAGTFFIVLADLLVLPALLGLAAKLSWSAPAGATGPLTAGARALPRWAPAVFWLSTTAILLGLPGAMHQRFDYDFAALEGTALRSYALDVEVNRLLGRSQTPVVMLTDTVADELPAAKALRARSKKLGKDSTISFVLSISDLVPADQEDKQEQLAELKELLSGVDPDDLSKPDRDRFEKALRLAEQPPFTADELPIQLRRIFHPKAGEREGGVVLAFPSVKMSDGLGMLRLSKEVRGIPLPSGKTISASSETLVVADILQMIFTEAPVVIAATLCLVLLSMWVLLGRFSTALWCFLPSLITTVGTLAFSHWLDIPLNYVNIVIIPVLFGIAVDGGVHLVLRSQDLSDAAGLAETARGILGATLTTALGFAALLLAHHPGLNSFGRLALLGLGVNVVATLLWLASLLWLRQIRAERQATAEGWLDRLAFDISTVWGAGYSPVAPGTFGTFAALPAAWALSYAPAAIRWAVIAALTLLSIWAAGRYVAKNKGALDPSEVVADEFVGLLIAAAFVPYTWLSALGAFALFRLFDISKPPPVGLIDRKLKTPAGIILDDVAAGFMAGGALLLIEYGLPVIHGWK